MLRRNRFIRYGIGIAILLVGGVVLFSHYRNARVQEPIKIYKVTRPAPRVQAAKRAPSAASQPDVTVHADAEPADAPNLEAPPHPETEVDVADGDVGTEPAMPVAVLSETPAAAAAVPDFQTTPAGFPLPLYWDQPEHKQQYYHYEHKLIAHVLVKLWHQGVRDFTGGSIGDDGKVHPHYRNTLYVRWKEVRHPDGTLRQTIQTCFGDNVDFVQKTLFDLPPPDMRLIDLNSPEGQGIDPYAFLTSKELPK